MFDFTVSIFMKYAVVVTILFVDCTGFGLWTLRPWIMHILHSISVPCGIYFNEMFCSDQELASTL